MSNLRYSLRLNFRWFHLWLGLFCGAFICIMGVSGAVVTFRPQLTGLLSPAAVSPENCRENTDWNRAQQEIESYMGAKLDRLYFPSNGDPRVQIRIEGEQEKLYRHVTYDGCAAKVLGATDLRWMYWMVDFHHNLRAERSGRNWAGVIGIVLLLSALGGLALWFLGQPNVARAFKVQFGRSNYRTSLDLHRCVGLAAMPLLLLPAISGIWLCYAQPMRAFTSWLFPVAADTRPPRTGKPAGPELHAGLGDIVNSARQALPGASIREIRMPEGYGAAQVRMWREGDFRSLGNNVVFVDSGTAKVLAVDLYDGKPSGNRLIQAMAGLHYGEWGGLTYRWLYGLSGFATALLFLTGGLIWWLPRRNRARQQSRVEPKITPQRAPVAH